MRSVPDGTLRKEKAAFSRRLSHYYLVLLISKIEKIVKGNGVVSQFPITRLARI